MARRVMARRVMARRVMARRVMARRVMARRVMARRVMARRVMARRVMARRVMARPVMSWRQAGAGGRLAGALKALGIPEFGEHQGSRRPANARDCFQKVPVPGKGLAAVDVLVDRFFKPGDLLVYAFEHRLERAGDRRMLRLANLVLQAVALFFELLEPAGHLLEAPLLRRRGLPGAWLLFFTKASQKTSVDSVGFRADRSSSGSVFERIGLRADRSSSGSVFERVSWLSA